MTPDELDDISIPPQLQFTLEAARRAIEQSDADIAAGRLIPVEDVLREVRARQAARLAAREAGAVAAE